MKVCMKILEREYPRSNVNRIDADRFNVTHRGSYRMIANRYRTEDEQDRYITAELQKPFPLLVKS